MKLLQIDFQLEGPFEKCQIAKLFWNELAKDISTEEGLIWKIWTENSVNKEAGGIYLFSDENNANRYLEKHKKKIKFIWNY